jgi:hypothetical protein
LGRIVLYDSAGGAEDAWLLVIHVVLYTHACPPQVGDVFSAAAAAAFVDCCMSVADW